MVVLQYCVNVITVRKEGTIDDLIKNAGCVFISDVISDWIGHSNLLQTSPIIDYLNNY